MLMTESSAKKPQSLKSFCQSNHIIFLAASLSIEKAAITTACQAVNFSFNDHSTKLTVAEIKKDVGNRAAPVLKAAAKCNVMMQ